LSNLGYIRAEMEKLESEMKRIALEAQQKQTCKLSDEDMKITKDDYVAHCFVTR
jgi:hypothetical protein